MDIVRRHWARPVVLLLVCLTSAATAFAQGATGTLTGTVIDSTGAAVPGATVNATEANTGTVRSGVSNEHGVFRMAALNPGRYSLSIELASFRPLTVADINLLSSETRDLGKLTLEVGAVSEMVSVTSEVTPVQVADSSRRSTITTDDIANIQTKGRDIYGLLAILPGVQDTNLNRDFAQWRSAISITINGMPSQSKDVRVDGLNIVDEGGCGTAFVNLNMDAIGEVQVISNGYTAENGRNNGGVISIITKSGTGTLKGAAWYNGRRDKFNENDYFREVANIAKPLYRVNISGYGLGGPVVIPGLVDSRTGKGGDKKFYFFVSQEYTDDARPSSPLRSNMPTDLEGRELLADPGHERRHTADHRPENRRPVPWERHSRRRDARLRRAVQLHQPAGPAHAQPGYDRERDHEPRGWAGMDVERDVRPDARARPHEPRAPPGCGAQRQDPHELQSPEGS
jgi:Carboxypeptidase regulatory-like domain/TonB-dependent Receptor Plug Domain